MSCARARVESRSIWLAALSSLSQIVGVVLSVIFVDKLGRRVLVLGSLVLISFCMLGLGASFYLARICPFVEWNHVVLLRLHSN